MRSTVLSRGLERTAAHKAAKPLGIKSHKCLTSAQHTAGNSHFTEKPRDADSHTLNTSKTVLRGRKNMINHNPQTSLKIIPHYYQQQNNKRLL